MNSVPGNSRGPSLPCRGCRPSCSVLSVLVPLQIRCHVATPGTSAGPPRPPRHSHAAATPLAAPFGYHTCKQHVVGLRPDALVPEPDDHLEGLTLRDVVEQRQAHARFAGVNDLEILVDRERRLCSGPVGLEDLRGHGRSRDEIEVGYLGGDRRSRLVSNLSAGSSHRLVEQPTVVLVEDDLRRSDEDVREDAETKRVGPGCRAGGEARRYDHRVGNHDRGALLHSQSQARSLAAGGHRAIADPQGDLGHIPTRAGSSTPRGRAPRKRATPLRRRRAPWHRPLPRSRARRGSTCAPARAPKGCARALGGPWPRRPGDHRLGSAGRLGRGPRRRRPSRVPHRPRHEAARPRRWWSRRGRDQRTAAADRPTG